MSKTGSLWNSINSRCVVGGTYQKLSPAYVGCECHFTDYQSFANWAIQQVGFGEGFQLDKDILVKRNKIYSADTCVFAPRQVNMFFVSQVSRRGDFPVGVSLRRDGVYAAQCSFDNKIHKLGEFSSVERAFVEYKTFKENAAKILAARWKGMIDERLYNALMSYQVSIDD